MPVQKYVIPATASTLLRDPDKRSKLRVASAMRWRAGLLGSSLGAATLGVLAGDPSVLLQSDPELARLLRGMALIKAALALAALAVIWWRYSRPLSNGLGTAYLIGATSMVFAAITVWQLSYLAFASILFHAGIFVSLGAAYLDTSGPAETRQQRPVWKQRA